MPRPCIARSCWRMLTCVVVALVASGTVRAQDASSPTRLVTSLYQRYAWEVVLRDGQGPLLSAPEAELARWFTPELVTLLLADRACAARTQQICALDFAPLWDSQDPEARGLAVEALPGAAGGVRVTFERGTPGAKVELRYAVTHTPAGWRIADIAKPGGWQLRKLLQPGRGR